MPSDSKKTVTLFWSPDRQVWIAEGSTADYFAPRDTANRDCIGVAIGDTWSADNPRTTDRKAARLRSAMAAMSNVMNCCLMLADTDYKDRLIEVGQHWQREELSLRWGADEARIKADASAAWSQAVRAGVAALPKPEPVLACQGDYEDD